MQDQQMLRQQMLKIHLSIIVNNEGFQHKVEFYQTQLGRVFGLNFIEKDVKEALRVLFELTTQVELTKHKEELLIDIPDQFYEGK